MANLIIPTRLFNSIPTSEGVISVPERLNPSEVFAEAVREEFPDLEVSVGETENGKMHLDKDYHDREAVGVFMSKIDLINLLARAIQKINKEKSDENSS